VEAISAVDEEGLLGADPSRGALIKILRELISGDAVVDDAAKKQSIAEFRYDVHEAGSGFEGFEVENIEFVVANDLLGEADVSVGTVADTGLPTGTDASAIEEVIDLTGGDVGGVVSPESERISKGPKESIFWHFLEDELLTDVIVSEARRSEGIFLFESALIERGAVSKRGSRGSG
jgi:hypothetical protein